MSGISHAVFLSYASQDAGAAEKICEALRAAGIEVFFDQSELRGGDAWDQKIRHQIHDCVLFMPVVSKHPQERLEGYFRLEWKLAVDRSHLMATERPFLVPVVDHQPAAAGQFEKFEYEIWQKSGRLRLAVVYRDDDKEPVNNRPPRRRISSGTHRMIRAP